jgi:hypothetical protein
MFALLAKPRKAPRTDHLRELQPDTTVVPHNLPESQIGETGHRCLQYRR